MIDHLSYSSIQSYLSCGRNWRYKYIDKLQPEVDSEAFLFGSAWHKMIGLVAGGQSLESAWNEAYLDKGVSFEGADLGHTMIKSSAINAHLQGLKPWKLEQYFEFTVPKVPVPIIGYIDMITREMIPVDFKTSGRKWSQQQADDDLQATFYIAGMHKLGLIESNQFPYPFEYHVFTKTKSPDMQILRTERSAEQVIGLFNLIGLVYDAIELNVYVPNPTTWKCSQNYCDFWNRCKGGLIDLRTD